MHKSLSNKKVLITGATGYIGSNLVSQLIRLNCDITCVNSSKQLKENSDGFDVENITYCDSIESLEPAFQHGKFYAIFHLAGFQALNLNSQTLNTTLNSNINFGCHILELSRQYDAEHLIYAESFFQFDQKGDYLPRNLYAASKQAFSDILLSYAINGLKSTSLVLFDVYGPYDSRNKLFNRLDQAFYSQEKLLLTPGKQIHYAIYITDVISALCDAAIIQKNNSFDRFWIAGEGLTLKETVELWSKIKQKKLNISWGGVEYFPHQVLNPFIGEKIPGWNAKVKLHEGLKTI